MIEMLVLQGRRIGHDRSVICERPTMEGCIAERDKRLQPTITVHKGRVKRVESEWCWTAITRKNARR